MPVMDEFKEERERIKTASFREKWKYFKDYYLKWVLGILFGIIVLISFIVSIVTKKEEVLHVSLINFNPLENEAAEVQEAFSEKYLIDTKKQQVIVDTSMHIAAGTVSDNSFMKYSYEDEQKLMALVLTNGTDLVISGQDVLEKYMQNGWFCSLREVLDEDVIRKYAEEDRVLYYEGEPAAIRMDEAQLFKKNYFYIGEGEPELYAGFVYGSQHADLAKAFLEFVQ